MVSDVFFTSSDGFHFKWAINMQQLAANFKILQIETSEIPMRVKGGFVNLMSQPSTVLVFYMV